MPIRDELRPAIERGLAFLDTVIEADGAWPCLRYKDGPWPDLRYADSGFTGPGNIEKNPGMAGFGVLALENCDHPLAQAIQSRTRNYLFRIMEYPGVWRYWPHIPPDVDDTAMCSLAVNVRTLRLFFSNIERILSNRDAEGRFLTWMWEPDWSGLPQGLSLPPETCPVVNANVISYLGDRPETRDAQQWLETLIEERREAGQSRHYVEPINFYHALARASGLAAPAFARLRPTLISRIVECRDDCGLFGNAMYSALALSALDMLGALQPEDMYSTLEQLLAAQRPDGGWPGGVHYVASPLLSELSLALAQGPVYWFFTEAISTACCIEAMERFLRMTRC